jgi:pimeloyl-ACP methyl ester carboxylesterase
VTDNLVMDPTETDAEWPIPPGRRVELAGRGTTFVREVAGPPGAANLLLHHGWGATGGLNWYPTFGPLAEHFRVLAPDVRGHGRGLRTRRVFRIADCADDSAATLLELDAAPAIVVGYSMGGPISQQLWRRHRDLVSGLVLCATSAGFFPGTRERMVMQGAMTALAGTLRIGTLASRIPFQVRPVRRSRHVSLPAWAQAEFRRHDLRMVAEAGHSIGTYHAPWIHEIDVPTVVIVTTDDHLVDPEQQYAMAAAIPGARTIEVSLNHLACTDPAFVAPLVDACCWVRDQAAARVAEAQSR